MDDFNVSSLHESKNEWGARLLTMLTPLIVEGLNSIFDEANKICNENDENDKYLMTFQNFISRIPKWNSTIIETETKRIVDRGGCGYLEDLVTCVHIIQLKLLTAIRVGQKQKKIDIDIPKLDDFIHKVYIGVARRVYKNVYLFEMNIPPLQKQKHHRELEIIIQECILNTIRENIPIESILRAYMDETIEEHVEEEIIDQLIEEPEKELKNESIVIGENKENNTNKKDIKDEEDKTIPKLETNDIILPDSLKGVDTTEIVSASMLKDGEVNAFPSLKEDDSGNGISFNNIDTVFSEDNKKELVEVPKDIDVLEDRLENNNITFGADFEDDNTMAPKLQILDTDANLDALDVHIIDPPSIDLEKDLLLEDIEVLT